MTCWCTFAFLQILLAGRLIRSYLTQLILKVQSFKLYNNKYMIAPTQKANTVIFAFIALLVFKLLRGKVFFINRKDNRNC